MADKTYTSMSRRKLAFCAGASAIVFIGMGLAAGIGIGIGLGHHMNHADHAAAVSSNKASTNDNDNSNTSASGLMGDPLPAWDWTNPNRKAYGVALGNWLLLERWMDEDWFTSTANDQVFDEWSWSQAVKDNGQDPAQVLQDRFDDFVQEDDIELMHKFGMALVRVPIGFWALIDTTADEPYVHAGQLAQIDRILPWLYQRGMRLLLDLHGLPGSQNGAQPSGHNSTTLGFYDADQQKRSDDTVQAAVQYIQSSVYASVFAGLAVANEPDTFSDQQLATLRDFYERSYKTLSEAKIPMIFHHAFKGLDYWKPFISGKDPKMLVMEDHPYPGNFPPQTDEDDIIGQVCYHASEYAKADIPVLVSEWSLLTGVSDAKWMNRFYHAQASAWSWSAGSLFWSWKMSPSSNPVLANNTNWQASSMVDLIQMGHIVPLPQNTENAGHVQRMVTGLNATCGPDPHMTWDNPMP